MGLSLEDCLRRISFLDDEGKLVSHLQSSQIHVILSEKRTDGILQLKVVFRRIGSDSNDDLKLWYRLQDLQQTLPIVCAIPSIELGPVVHGALRGIQHEEYDSAMLCWPTRNIEIHGTASSCSHVTQFRRIVVAV